MALEEWEKHVTKEGRRAWCGAALVFFEWAFVDADHALRSLDRTRLQPCPACLAAIRAAGPVPVV